MAPLTAPLHVGSQLPMALGQALLVLGAAVAVFAGVAYLFYRDHREAFREVKR